VDEPAAPPASLEPPDPAPPDQPNPLSRYRALQVISILLAAGGFALVAVVAWLNRDLLTADGPLPTSEEAIGILIGLILGGLALIVGLVMNAVRAIVVRQALPPQRYRGPSVLVLLVLAAIVTTVASLGLVGELAALETGGELSSTGSLLLLTVTQLGLLAAAALFVAAPRALEGVRLLPQRGLWRSVLIGLGLVLPSWIGAQLISLLVVTALERLGMRPDVGLAEEAIARVDPVVLVVALVMVAPIAEEVFFRGVVYNAWEREYGPRMAVYGSALLFALIHQSVFLLLPIFALGVVLAWLYRRTRSLPAAIVLHAGFNGLTLALGLLDRYEIIRLP
jgi:membrane protease YdiL (CAAX protease family)